MADRARLKAFGTGRRWCSRSTALTKWLVETQRVALGHAHGDPGLLRHRSHAEPRRGVRDASTIRPRSGATVLLVRALAGGGGVGRRRCSGRPGRSTALTRRGACALILGGAAGNLYDRSSRAASPTFCISTSAAYHWPTFNVADSAIVDRQRAAAARSACGRSASRRELILPNSSHRRFLPTYGVLVAAGVPGGAVDDSARWRAARA